MSEPVIITYGTCNLCRSNNCKGFAVIVERRGGCGYRVRGSSKSTTRQRQIMPGDQDWADAIRGLVELIDSRCHGDYPAELLQALAEQHPCKECQGSGYSAAMGAHGQPEADGHCPACDGTGVTMEVPHV